jgi:MYXO-CTERM domain-containing protein
MLGESVTLPIEIWPPGEPWPTPVVLKPLPAIKLAQRANGVGFCGTLGHPGKTGVIAAGTRGTTQVPEPMTTGLWLGLTGLGMTWVARRRRA